MRIGILGAGAIGRYVGGSLIASGADVVFYTRRPDESVGGLAVAELGGHVRAELAADRVRSSTSLAACDAVLCCVKSAATTEAARAVADTRLGCVIVSLQNGVRNPERLRTAVPERRVLAGIVGFNVVRRDPLVQRTTSGPIAIEASDDRVARELVRVLIEAGLDVDTPRDIARHQWTKLLVNLGNAVSALSDAPTRELMLSRGFRQVLAALIGEAVGVLRAAKLRPARLRGLPVGWMPRLLRLPTPVLRVVARTQLRVDPEARSSMWEDLTRGRPTEIDDLNGEIVRLAEQLGIDAPRNRRIVELVRDAERAAAGSPRLTAAALAAEITRSG